MTQPELVRLSAPRTASAGAAAADGAASLTLVPAAGGRASSLVVDGLEVLAHDSEAAVGWGWFPMAPWPGRLTGNAVQWAGVRHVMPVTFDRWAIHGTVYDAAWEVEETTAERAVLGIDLGASPDDAWPWAGRVRATWALAAVGPAVTVHTTLEVTSAGAEFPVELGWHPWFRRRLARGGPVELDLPATTMYARGADHLPTGALVERPDGPYDDTFPLPGGEVGLHWPDALSARCRTDCGHVVVFDERPGAVCVEPQTGPPDWINRHPRTVAPGAPVVARATWTFVPLAQA